MVQRKFIQPAIDMPTPPVAREFSVSYKLAPIFNTTPMYVARA
jgi:hypothetical protein